MDKQYVKNKLDSLYAELQSAKSEDERRKVKDSIEMYTIMFKKLYKN